MLFCAIAVELIIRLRLSENITSFYQTVTAAYKVFGSKEMSEHCKARAMKSHALGLTILSAKLLGTPFCLFFVAICMLYFSPSLLIYCVSIGGIIESIFTLFGYKYIRAKLL